MGSVEEVRKTKSVAAMKARSTIKSWGNISGSHTSRLRMRQGSYGFSGVSGIRVHEKTSAVAMEQRRPPLLFLPTYQLESYHRFNVENITKEVETIIQINFANHKYDAQESPALALRLAGETMRTVKIMGFNRYRIISVVTIAQRRAQSINNAVSFIWDHERDDYVEAHSDTPSAFLQIIVFGVYLD